MSKPLIDPDAENVLDRLLRESLQEGLRDQDLFPEPEPASQPMSPGWEAKEEELLKKAFGDDFDYSEWTKIHEEEQT